MLAGRMEYYNGSIDELTDEYAKTLDKYARYPRSMIALPREKGRIVEILAEIHRWNPEQEQPPLKEIVESGKGEYHLMISEPDMGGNAHLTPVTLHEGWEGRVIVHSDEFGVLQIISIEIPEFPELYIDWLTGHKIAKQQSKFRGQPVRLKITGYL